MLNKIINVECLIYLYSKTMMCLLVALLILVRFFKN